MSCKSAIYVANPNTQTLAVGNSIAFTDTVRKFGSNFALVSNGIRLIGAGYYDVDASVTITGTTAGTVQIYLVKDGVAIEGASASVSVAVGDVVTVPIDAIVKQYGCCVDNNSVISLVVGGVACTVNNAGLVMEKL